MSPFCCKKLNRKDKAKAGLLKVVESYLYLCAEQLPNATVFFSSTLYKLICESNKISKGAKNSGAPKNVKVNSIDKLIR